MSICELETNNNIEFCVGCGRTTQEIAEWSTASKQRKREINKMARLRKDSVEKEDENG